MLGDGNGYRGDDIALQLIVWAGLCIVASAIGLLRARREYSRAFWLMTALWGAIDAVLGVAGLLGKPMEPAGLRRLLLVNAGLDVLYLAAGIALLTRPRAQLKGFGVAIIVQGAFLLVFDLCHAVLLRVP